MSVNCSDTWTLAVSPVHWQDLLDDDRIMNGDIAWPTSKAVIYHESRELNIADQARLDIVDHALQIPFILILTSAASSRKSSRWNDNLHGHRPCRRMMNDRSTQAHKMPQVFDKAGPWLSLSMTFGLVDSVNLESRAAALMLVSKKRSR